jgi:hypothetical protein
MAEKASARPSGTPAGNQDTGPTGPFGMAAGKYIDIDDIFGHLELNENELDDVVIDVEKTKVYQDEVVGDRQGTDN